MDAADDAAADRILIECEAEILDEDGKHIYASHPDGLDHFAPVDERSFAIIFFDKELLEFAAPYEQHREIWGLRTSYGPQPITEIVSASTRPQLALMIVLAAVGWVWGFAFGAIMNLWSWPFIAADATTLPSGQVWEPGSGLPAALGQPLVREGVAQLVGGTVTPARVTSTSTTWISRPDSSVTGESVNQKWTIARIPGPTTSGVG